VPFLGGRFDVHHEGVFQVLKHKDIEVQVLMKDCGVDFQTKDRLAWTGGIAVKCAAAAAISINAASRYQFFAHSGVMQKIEGGSAKDVLGTSETKDGWELTSVKGKADFVKYFDEDYENSIQVTFQQDPKHEALSVFVLIEERKRPRMLFGQSPGICGGGGESQLAAAKVDMKMKAKAMEQLMPEHKEASRFACKDCSRGLGTVGAMCECRSWAVAKARQLFSKKYSRGSKSHLSPSKMSQKKVSSNLKLCKAAILSHPAGKLFYKGDIKAQLPKDKYAYMKRLFDLDIIDCALDRTAAVVFVKTQKVLIQDVCWTMVLQTPRHIHSKHQNTVMCRLVKKCVGNGLRDQPVWLDRDGQKHPKCP
jgi:hypothetical protein